MKLDRYTIQNVIVSYDGKDITGQKPKTNLDGEDLGNYGEHKQGDDGTGGHLYLILPHNENVAYVGNVSIPKELRGKGIGKKIYQAIADKINKPIRSSLEHKNSKGETQHSQYDDGKNFWKNRDSFQPRTNTQFPEENF
jgi:hypothetical protein